MSIALVLFLDQLLLYNQSARAHIILNILLLHDSLKNYYVISNNKLSLLSGFVPVSLNQQFHNTIPKIK